MSEIKCCFFCTYYTGTIVSGSCNFVCNDCWAVSSPFRESCSSYSFFLPFDPDDEFPEYDPSDPFGHFDPGFDIEPYNEDDSLDDSYLVPDQYFWDRD